MGLWGVTRFPQLEGIPLLGEYGGSDEGLWSAYSTIKKEALVQILAQKQSLPIERDKPVRALFMKFHFIPHWQPFKQWLWGNVSPRMSNNSRDQQLFCPANTLIKRVKIFLPESFKECSMKDICKQEQKAAQTKVFLSKGCHLLHYHNHLHLSVTAKDRQKQHAYNIFSFILTLFALHLLSACYFSLQYGNIVKIVLCLVSPNNKR